MRTKAGLTVVEVAILLAFLVLLTAVSVPALFQNQQKKRAAQCAMNLDAIAEACKRYASEEGGFPQSLSALVPTYLDSLPSCPSGGVYAPGTPEGDPPTCSIPGHHWQPTP